jgi:hypothetical protein
MRRHGWLALALIAPLLAACGGDDEPSADEVPKPSLTVPQDETGPDVTSTDTTGTTTGETTETTPGNPDGPLDQPNPGNGGTPAPDSNNPEPQPPPDSPSNDTPPDPGSPADRFEQFCAQNPGAC